MKNKLNKTEEKELELELNLLLDEYRMTGDDSRKVNVFELVDKIKQAGQQVDLFEIWFNKQPKEIKHLINDYIVDRVQKSFKIGQTQENDVIRVNENGNIGIGTEQPNLVHVGVSWNKLYKEEIKELLDKQKAELGLDKVTYDAISPHWLLDEPAWNLVAIKNGKVIWEKEVDAEHIRHSYHIATGDYAVGPISEDQIQKVAEFIFNNLKDKK